MLRYIYDCAFNNNVQQLDRVSYNETIDVVFGIYNSMASINLYPSQQKIDWKINFDFFPTKVKPSYADKDSTILIHKGYAEEWDTYRNLFIEFINLNEEFKSALQSGLIVSGRSKGGGEASIIALDLVKTFYIPKDKAYLGLIEAPKVGNDEFCKEVEKSIGHIYKVKYGSDIVTMIPPFMENPGELIQFYKSWKPFSVIDHALGCFAQERIYPLVEKYDKGELF